MTNETPHDDMRKVWQNQKVEYAPMSLDEIHKKAQRFQRSIHRRNVREYVAAAIVVAGFGFYIWRFDDILVRIGSALVITGALYVVHHLHKMGSARTVPADLGSVTCLRFHRDELGRQRDLLRGVWRWCLLPLVPGLALFLFGPALRVPLERWGPVGATAAFYAAVFVAVWALNQWAARKLQRQIDELDALERE